jgi:hypothetical protein
MKGRSLLCQCISRTSSAAASSTSFSRHAAPTLYTGQRYQRQRSHFHFASATKPLPVRSFSEQVEARHASQTITPKAAISTPSRDEERSLHSTIHYVLTRDVGRMSIANLQKARAFLSITSRWKNEKGAVLTEQLLERLYEEKYIGNNLNVVIDADMYNICMDAWNKSNADGQKVANQVESIINRMEQRYFDHREAPPDNVSYNCLINAYSKSEEDLSDQVEATLEKMNNFAQDNNAFSSETASSIRPDETTYNSMMNYYASRKNHHISAQRAEDLLLEMSAQSQQQNSGIQMNSTSFNIVLKAWGNSGGGIQGAKRAEELLRMMLKLRKQHENVQPTTLSFSTVINAYSKVAPEDSAIAVDRVLALLDELEGLYIPDSENINSCYNAAANVIAKSNLRNPSEMIMELMVRMKNMDAEPDMIMYTSCLEACVKTGDDDSIKQGKEMLENIIEDPQFQPTAANFNILLNAILKSKSEQKIKEGEDLIAKMLEIGDDSRPDSASFNMIISALSRSSSVCAEEKAVGYLRTMLRLYKNEKYEKAKPDSFAFNCVINMLSRSEKDWADDVIYRTLASMEAQQKYGNDSVLLDTITYNVVIGKLAQSVHVKNAKKVMKLLDTMETMAADGSVAVTPDIITYTNVLKLQIKLNPQRAARIASSFLTRAISRGDEIYIDQVGFYTLLHALSRSNQLEDAVLAQKALEWIEQSDRAVKILNSEAYNLVLIAYSKIKTEASAVKALSFLSDRIQSYRKCAKSTILPTKAGFSAAFIPLCSADKMNDAFSLLKIMKALRIEPDAGCYISMLSAFSGRRSANNAVQAQRVIQQMKDDMKHVPTPAFNAAINACSWVSGSPIVKRKALDIAFEMFQQARKDNAFDAITFGLLTKAIMHLSKDDVTRMKLLKPVLELCAEQGLVGNMMQREMRHLTAKLITPGNIPQEWRKNAKDT